LAQQCDRDGVLRGEGENPFNVSTETFLDGCFDDGAIANEKNLLSKTLVSL
jgi:hypothetical protein